MDKLKAYFSKQADCLCAILYGSFASDRMTPESDVDLAVYMKKELSAKDKLTLLDELSVLLGRSIDVVDLRKAHAPLTQEILTKGVYVKLESLALKEQLIGKMHAEVADFLPIKRRTQKEKLKRFLSNG